MRVVDVLRAGWMMAALTASLGGCTSDGEDPSGAAGAAGSAGSGGADAEPVAKCDRAGDLDLNGTWLIKARLNVVMQSIEGAPVQVCPVDQTGPAEMLLVGRVEQEGSELKALTVTICDFSMPEVTAVLGKCTESGLGSVRSRVSPSEALRDALPSLVVPKIQGKLGGVTDGASFEPERLVFALGSETLSGPMAVWKGGAVCDDSKNPLGTGEGCEAQCVSSCSDVVDSDGDKLPGVTMAVCGFTQKELDGGTKCNVDTPTEAGATLQGKAGVNFRVNPQFTGKAENSCMLRGSVDAEIDYNVLGARMSLAGNVLSVQRVRDSIPAFDVVPDKSKFTAYRVDGKYGSPDLGLAADNPKAACKAAIDNQSNFLH